MGRDYLLSAYFAAYKAYVAVVDYLTISPKEVVPLAKIWKYLGPKARIFVSAKRQAEELEGLDRLADELAELVKKGWVEDMRMAYEAVRNNTRGMLEREKLRRRIYEEFGLDTQPLDGFEARLNFIGLDAKNVFEAAASALRKNL